MSEQILKEGAIVKPVYTDELYYSLLGDIGMQELTIHNLEERIQELEGDLEIMVQTARTADQGIKERDEYIEQLETKVRQLADLLTVMAARHIAGRDPDNLKCNEASVEAMQLVTGKPTAKEIQF